MRAIDGPCAHHFEGTADEELFQLCREHVDRDHPETQRTNEQIRERLAVGGALGNRCEEQGPMSPYLLSRRRQVSKTLVGAKELITG
jgi:hypothetical protein